MMEKGKGLILIFLVCTMPAAVHIGFAQTGEQVLEVATTEYAPFDFTEGGQVVGITADIIYEAFERMGYEVNITSYPWARAVSMAQSGAVDAISVIFISEERKEFLDFPAEYLVDDGQAFFSRRHADIEFDGNLSSLSDYSIGTIRGYAYGDEFATAVANGTITIDESSDLAESIRKLLGGRVDLVLESRYNFLYAIGQQGAADAVTELTPGWRSANLYLAFSKAAGHTDMVPEFDRVMREIKADGTQQAIIDSYTQ